MISLEKQLGRGLLISLTIAFFLLWFLSGVSLRQLVESSVVSRLNHDMESILAKLELTAEGKLHLPVDLVPMHYRHPLSGHYFYIQAGKESIPSRSLWDFALTSPGEGVSHIIGPQGDPHLLSHQTFHKGGKQVTFLIAENTVSLEKEVIRFQTYFAGLCTFALVMLLMMQKLLLRRSLRPMEMLRKRLFDIKRGEHLSLEEDESPVELLPLVREINRLLMVVRQRLERSRTSLGNLAHLLKTPLACLSQAAGDESESPEAFRDLVGEQTERLRLLIDRELKRARLAGQGVDGHGLDIASEADELFSIMRRIHSGRSLELISRVKDGVLFHGDREDLLEILGNLIDNGCQWAISKVVLSALAEDVLCITVEDDGLGGDASLLERLNRHGHRVDESAHGTGLGVVLAREITEAYGGELIFDFSPELNGIRAQIRLPNCPIG